MLRACVLEGGIVPGNPLAMATNLSTHASASYGIVYLIGVVHSTAVRRVHWGGGGTFRLPFSRNNMKVGTFGMLAKTRDACPLDVSVHLK